MRKFRFLPVVSLVLFYSCEKIIDVDIDPADRQLVINAAICIDDSLHTAYVSTSGNYTNGEGIEPVHIDSMILTDPMGNRMPFNSASIGEYTLSGVLLSAGSYSLEVFHNGVVVYANSNTSGVVPIDSLYFVEMEGGFGPGGGGGGSGGPGGSGAASYELHVVFKDTPGVSNYYRITYSVNGVPKEVVLTANDDLSDGSVIDYTVFRSSLRANDTVDVSLWSIDEGSYLFYSTLQDVLMVNPFTSSTPFNPSSNLSSGLGVFCVYKRSDMTGVVAD